MEVETLVAKRAIQFASELDIISAILEDDSQVLIQFLQSGVEYLSPYGLLLDDVGLVYGFFNQFRLSHVKRKGNKIAYSLAKFTINVSNILVQMEDIPP